MFDGDVAYRCPECNELFWIESGTPKDNEYNFCPKCGKRLVASQESEKWVNFSEDLIPIMDETESEDKE